VTDVEAVLRDLAPQVLGALVRRYGAFDTCEDAVQEALLAATVQWPSDGRPDDPKSWLITVASRRRIEMWRSESARQRREETVALREPPEPAQVALTLRAVGGLTTAEIARAFLVPEATVAQRISRAKQKIKASRARFTMPPPAQRAERLAAVLKVLYLIFNEGYTASSGEALHRVELTAEAIRLTRQIRERLPDDGEVAGLLALMLLTDARRPARTRPDGTLVPLQEQDRARWDAPMIAEGVALITATLQRAPVGPYQLQAAIAAVHDEAPRAADTDWPQIVGLYDVLSSVEPGPMVTLNRAVAVAMVDGPQAGLDLLRDATDEPALQNHHRLHAVRAHLLELAGQRAAARTEYELAARRTLSTPEQRYLESRARKLG
jgi:predicted RNA polymerase sigma factor